MTRHKSNRHGPRLRARATMCGLNNLPNEILDQILKEIPEKSDLSSLSRCSRGLYWAISGMLFTRAFEERTGSKGVNRAVSSLFTHAVKHDSQNLIQWLIFREYGSRLRGPFPLMNGFTFVHYALLQDAPKVAIMLLKHGTDLDEENVLYPDLKSLHLAIARPHSSRLGALDGPLRTACSYALPRTAEFLLIRGADPNAYSDFGFAAIHIAVRRRLPWSQFKLFARVGGEKDSENALWEAKISQTVEVLLHFGADCNLPALTSRRHQCNHECWRSLACAPMEQRVLHIAAGGGYTSVISALVKRKANIFEADEQGNLPIVHAMAQGHDEIATLLLQYMKRYAKKRGVNPIVCKTTRGTVLHIACRFGYHDVVSALLKEGADVNGVDSLGRTPLHEALGQCAPDLEDRLVETLYLLSEKNASPDAVDCAGKKARDMGERHRFSGVRALFEYATMARYEWQRLTEPSGDRKENTEDDIRTLSSWDLTSPELPPPICLERVAMNVPTWVKKKTFPGLKDPRSHPKVIDPASSKENSAWGPRKAPKPVEPVLETEAKQGKKGGRKTKWTRVSLKK